MTHAPDITSASRRVALVLSFVPLALVMIIVLMSAWSTRGPIANANATDVRLEGRVPPRIGTVFIDTSACAANSGVIGDVLPGSDPWKTAQQTTGQSCTLTFGTADHLAGADLAMIDDPAAAGVGGPAMRCTAGGCAGRSIADYSGAGEPAVNTSAFGAQLLGSSGAASRMWSAAPAVHAVADAGNVACRTNAVGTGSCSFTWGVAAAVGDVPGSYRAQIQSLVLTR